MKNKDQFSKKELDQILGGATTSGVLSNSNSTTTILPGCRKSCDPGCRTGCQLGCVQASGKFGYPDEK